MAMKTFLQTVAHDIYNRWGGDLSTTALIFSNKRAGLFMNDYLAAESDSPVWSPACLSISDLFLKMSPLRSGDRIKLVCDLYKVFRQETGTSETLDSFYPWGEVLLNDFDSLDKALADADALFANIKDLKEIDSAGDFLTPEQTEVVKSFFSNFSANNTTELKRRFMLVWNKLAGIYHSYRELLRSQGIAYEGMIYRDALESFDASMLEYERYVFVGFNALNRVERELFGKVNDTGRASFYWDYDNYYMDDIRRHEAGTLIRADMERFPSPLDKSLFNCFAERDKKITYVSAPNEVSQAKYLNTWLKDTLQGGAGDNTTAVVLCNEALLMPLLHSLPQGMDDVNITMGYPFSQTPVSMFVRQLLALHVDARLESGGYLPSAVIQVLSHSYAALLCPEAGDLLKELKTESLRMFTPERLCRSEVLQLMFADVNGDVSALCGALLKLLGRLAVAYRDNETGGVEDQLHEEAIFRAYTAVNRLASLVGSGDLDVSAHTFARLAGKIFDGLTIPFHGEPLGGVQIMGVLETRNLDFKNIIMLSVNEGMMPKTSNDPSFIPYNMRKAFGLLTFENRNSIYAYYFYRLLQRAENVTLAYNASTSGMNSKEMSRFMLQLLAESGRDIERVSVDADQTLQRMAPLSVPKDAAVIDRLASFRRFSASALNTYIDCRLKFYYTYILGLKERKPAAADIDVAMFGTIFHRAMELIYIDLTAHGRTVRAEDIDRVREGAGVEAYVDKALKESLYPSEDSLELNGMQMIKRKVIVQYVENMLAKDRAMTPFDVLGMEQETYFDVSFEADGVQRRIRLGGIIDRIDCVQGVVRVADYKTGSHEQKFTGVPDLFFKEKDRSYHWLQTILYCMALQDERGRNGLSTDIAPNLIYIQKNAGADAAAVREQVIIKQKLFEESRDEFREHLQTLLADMFSSSVPFTQAATDNPCRFCDFKGICGRIQ